MSSHTVSATPSSPASVRPDRRPKRSRYGLRSLAAHLAPTLTAVGILVIWEAACRTFHIPQFLLPAPTAILKAGLAMSGSEWAGDIGATLRVALEGYVVSILISLPLATLLAMSPMASRTIYPILVVINSTPIVAVAPIIVVVLGVGDLPRVAITSIITFFPLVISTATGILATPDELVELSRSLRATRGREIVQIRLPYAVPHIFSALKVSITLAIIGAVVAEFVAAERGLGYAILFATSTFKIPQAFACLAVLVMLSLSLFRIVVWVQGWLFPWSLPREKRS